MRPPTTFLITTSRSRLFCRYRTRWRRRRGLLDLRRRSPRRRHADVHADHADADAVAKLARGLPALREDRGRVGKAGRSNHLDPLIEIADVRHRRDRPENLLLADRHVGL